MSDPLQDILENKSSQEFQKVNQKPESPRGLNCYMCTRPAAKYIGPKDPAKRQYCLPMCKKHIRIVFASVGKSASLFWQIVPNQEPEEIIATNHLSG